MARSGAPTRKKQRRSTTTTSSSSSSNNDDDNNTTPINKVVIIRTAWNVEIVDALVKGCKDELKELGVKEIIEVNVPGAFELPFAAQHIINTQKPDAVVAIGCLIKGNTMHFEYICESVSHGLMRVGLDTSVPVIFGVLTCLTEEQAKMRAGLIEGHHNHGPEWADAAVQMARLKAQ
jgi:6,7-dimethyl-8-ribityllumazine synthase